MSKKLKDLAAEALELPLIARAELAKRLLDSLEDISEEENEKLWAEEAERRYAEFKKGKAKAVAAEQVFARAKTRSR